MLHCAICVLDLVRVGESVREQRRDGGTTLRQTSKQQPCNNNQKKTSNKNTLHRDVIIADWKWEACCGVRGGRALVVEGVAAAAAARMWRVMMGGETKAGKRKVKIHATKAVENSQLVTGS